MGRLSNQLSRGGGPRPRSNGSQSGPLRRIVDHTSVRGVLLEVLECGHYQLPKRDLMGETLAVRRRCRKCRRGDAPDCTVPHGQS